MRGWNPIVAVCAIVVMHGAQAAPRTIDIGIDNPAIDIAGYLRVSRQALDYRETHRVSESDFVRMSREPGTVVLDARSKQKYDELHVRGAINLSFSDIAMVVDRPSVNSAARVP